MLKNIPDDNKYFVTIQHCFFSLNDLLKIVQILFFFRMQSLIDLCCKVLAENLQAIDGLDFVPEHLGRKISKFVSQSLLNSPLVSLDAYIRLFFQAYGGLFISGFRLQPCPTFSTWVKALSHCNSLTVLCLDSCNLELEHSDVLPYIGRVQSLKFLSLRWNTLTNDSVRSLTAYWRFCGGCKLSIVDISGNPFLGETVVRLLTQLSSLQVVYLSDTGVAVCLVLLVSFFGSIYACLNL